MKNYFDSRHEVFVNLYKTAGDKKHYWQLWNTSDHQATLNYGCVGELGQVENFSEESPVDFRNKVNSMIDAKANDGYKEIPFEKFYTLEVTFKLKTWGTSEDLDRREKFRSIITEKLGWTGNGRCDDGDIGSGEMSLFAEVVDPYLAMESLKGEFKNKGIKDEHYFTISLGDSLIGKFSD